MIEHVNVYAFPAVTLGILYIANRQTPVNPRSSRFFGRLLLMTLMLILAETVTWLSEGSDFPMAGRFFLGANAAYYLLLPSLGVNWFLYVYNQTFAGRTFWRSGRRAALFAVAAAYLGLILLSIWNGCVFAVGEGNVCRPGPLYFVPYALISIFTLAATFIALRQSFRESPEERRRECRYLAAFAILPGAGMVAQSLAPGWWLVWPLTTLSFLLIYLNTRNQQGIVDALTGLNNRGALDGYLRRVLSRNAQRGSYCLVLMDVDDFKSINDRFGHGVGDDALWQAANLLRGEFGKSGAFLARYGGDEFVMVCECRGEAQAQALLERLRAAVAESNRRERHPYVLSLSAGYTLFGGGTHPSTDAILAEADERMYRQKNRGRAGA